MIRVNTSCFYVISRRGGVKHLVTAMNRREFASSVDFIKLNESVTDPDDLKQAEKDGKAAEKIAADNGNKRTRATGKTKRTVSVDPGLADPVSPEPPPPPPKKAVVKKKLTAKQLALQKEARNKAAEKKAAAKEKSAKDEAAAKAAE